LNSDAEITQMLNRLGARADGPLAGLLPVVYEQLKRAARRQLQRERADHTLSTTALVHETYLKLAEQDQQQWRNRDHFYAVAAIVMRRVVIDHAKSVLAAKRGSGRKPLALDDVLNESEGMFSAQRASELVELDAALDRLRALDERACKVVECRFFAGLSVEETASALQVAPVTVKRDWSLARAWLQRALADG
jgi:RNA polymerase sigma factor (TIGR02999 family)